MEDLLNKDKSIVTIINLITDKFGSDYFEPLDFWDADAFAIGFKKGNKLVYVSSWDFRLEEEVNMKYYVEFEILNENTTDTKEVYRIFKGVGSNDLITQIENFIKGI